MRIGHRKPGSAIRTAVLAAACLAFVGITSGLLLTLHLGDAEHCGDHDSYHCFLCRQLLVVGKKLVIAPATAITCEAEVHWLGGPPAANPLPPRRPETVQPRGPPPRVPS